MNLRGNVRMLRAWERAMRYGYFTPSYWRKYWYLCEEHNYRQELWFDRELERVR